MPDIPNENSAEYKKQASSHKKNIAAAAVKKEEFDMSEKTKMDGVDDNGSKTCWKGYRKQGTKSKGGKEVNNCVKAGYEPEGDTIQEKNGLYANIHAKKKRGGTPAKPGSKNYPDSDAFRKSAKTAKNEEFGLTEKKEEEKEEKKFCKLCQKPETRKECSYGGSSWDRFSEPMPSLKKEEVEPIAEKAPSGGKYERMVNHIKKGYSKDGSVSNKEKSISYATAWKAKNKDK